MKTIIRSEKQHKNTKISENLRKNVFFAEEILKEHRAFHRLKKRVFKNLIFSFYKEHLGFHVFKSIEK